jgi:hypothetical protein
MANAQMLSGVATMWHVTSTDAYGAPTTTRSVLSHVMLGLGSRNRLVDVLGASGAKKMTLLFFIGQSEVDGSLDSIPSISAGDIVAEGDVSSVPTSHWAVDGVLPGNSERGLHHLEVSLV